MGSVEVLSLVAFFIANCAANMPPKRSPLWKHWAEKPGWWTFKSPSHLYNLSLPGFPHIVICNHCSINVRRGSPEAKRGTWSLRNMENHLERKHADQFAAMKDSRSLATILDPR